MKNYLSAKKIWDALSLSERKNILRKHGRNQVFSSRSYPFLPKEVRADIQSDLLKQVPATATPARQITPHWTEIY